MKLFVVVFFFIANVFTNVVVCSAFLGIEKQNNRASLAAHSIKSGKTMGALTVNLIPENQNENEDEDEPSNVVPNAEIEDEHLTADPVWLALVSKIKSWHFSISLRTSYTEIVLPPPERC